MSAMSYYLQGKLLDHVLRGNEPDTSLLQPSGVYVSLHDGDPEKTGENEIEGGGYIRQQAYFDDPSNGTALTTEDLVFDDLEATTVTWVGIWDSESGGNFLYQGFLATSRVVAAGENLIFPSHSFGVAHE